MCLPDYSRMEYGGVRLSQLGQRFSCEGNVMNSALENLRRDFGGDIVEPGDAEYESASRTLCRFG